MLEISVMKITLPIGHGFPVLVVHVARQTRVALTRPIQIPSVVSFLVRPPTVAVSLLTRILVYIATALAETGKTQFFPVPLLYQRISEVIRTKPWSGLRFHGPRLGSRQKVLSYRSTCLIGEGIFENMEYKTKKKFVANSFLVCRRFFSFLPTTGYQLPAREGFTILYATLVGVLTLSIGLGIFGIALKELRLSSSGRESQFAFYASDSGVECAVYWDLNGAGVFPRPSVPALPATSISCNGTTLIVTPGARDSASAVSSFTLPLTPGVACAVVVVTKTDPEGDGIDDTKIESRGQNDCVNLQNPRRVERAIRVRY